MAKKETNNYSELIDDIASSLAKSFKNDDFKSNIYLSDDGIANVTDYVPTGLDMLDIAISNRRGGGYPVGRIIEITGLEASGKSLLAAYALRNTQLKGGVAVYIDTEAAVSKDYLQAIGVDVTKLMYIPVSTIEEVHQTIDVIIERVRLKDKKKLVTIVVDSVMGASTQSEMNSESYGVDGYATAKALAMSKNLRRLTNVIAREKICLIYTNQLRSKVGLVFGQEYTTAGGRALGFHASVRIRLTTSGKISIVVNEIKNIVGVNIVAEITKNRLGPPLKKVEFDIYYSSGIDNYGAWLKALKKYKIVSSAGAWYTFKFPMALDIVDSEGVVEKNQTELKFQSKDFSGYLERNTGLREVLYDIICEKFIMKYELNKDYGIDDIKVDKTGTIPVEITEDGS